MYAVLAVIIVVSFLVACLLTGLTRRYALTKGMIDVPNARSSHTTPTPRGGGLAIACVVLAGAALLSAPGWIPPRLAWALCGGGLLIAAVGWIDDRRGLSPLSRATAHAVAAGWALAWLGGLPGLSYGPGRLYLGLPGSLLGLVALVWMINLYNFMDGIDGLAATEAVLAAGMAGLLLFAGGSPEAAALAWIVAAASAGFLVWNWAPAKIFMGDVASGLLGFVFGVLAVQTENQGTLPALIWFLLLGVFFVDTTATLLRRLMQGEKWYEAHRTHAFQRAVQSGLSHAQVTLSVAGLNLLLFALAAVAWQWPVMLLPAVATAVVGLLLLWRRCQGLAVLAVVGQRPAPPSSGTSHSPVGDNG